MVAENNNKNVLHELDLKVSEAQIMSTGKATPPASNVEIPTNHNVTTTKCLTLCQPAADTSLLEVAKVAGPYIGLLVLGFAIYQYMDAQRWKRNEFAASLLKELTSNDDLVACCNILDYPNRLIILNHRKRKNDKPTVFYHDRNRLLAAMAVERPEGGFKSDQIIYRDLFDHLFSYLSQIEHFCTQKLVASHDVQPLHYWLEKILFVKDLNEDVFGKFVCKYHPGVLRLAKLFEKKKLLQSDNAIKSLEIWKKQSGNWAKIADNN